jgi:hypothetical protein
MHGVHVRDRVASISRCTLGGLLNGLCSWSSLPRGWPQSSRGDGAYEIQAHVLLRVCLHWTVVDLNGYPA